jgi:hypothetical protein
MMKFFLHKKRLRDISKSKRKSMPTIYLLKKQEQSRKRQLLITSSSPRRAKDFLEPLRHRCSELVKSKISSNIDISIVTFVMSS